ncbi:hypothetical protein [Paenibacillus sp. UNC496MF]|uniref:hypothetical protein n=1 Tax=Paenibacillus sp. UNC496MF TaxID=1502753 RepID=UPI001C43530D|nr:hypothetical protein [Paenibacillus sp. UNC496MF]
MTSNTGFIAITSSFFPEYYQIFEEMKNERAVRGPKPSRRPAMKKTGRKRIRPVGIGAARGESAARHDERGEYVHRTPHEVRSGMPPPRGIEAAWARG